MSKNVRFVRLKAKPGMRDEVWRVWEKYARDYVVNSTSTISFYFCYDDNDPDTVVVFQLTADQSSGMEFAQQPWFADYQRETAALVGGPSEIYSATPQWVKSVAS